MMNQGSRLQQGIHLTPGAMNEPNANGQQIVLSHFLETHTIPTRLDIQQRLPRDGSRQSPQSPNKPASRRGSNMGRKKSSERRSSDAKSSVSLKSSQPAPAPIDFQAVGAAAAHVVTETNRAITGAEKDEDESSSQETPPRSPRTAAVAAAVAAIQARAAAAAIQARGEEPEVTVCCRRETDGQGLESSEGR